MSQDLPETPGWSNPFDHGNPVPDNRSVEPPAPTFGMGVDRRPPVEDELAKAALIVSQGLKAEEARQGSVTRQSAEHPAFAQLRQPQEPEVTRKGHKGLAVLLIGSLLGGAYGYDNVLNGGKETKTIMRMAGFGNRSAVALAPNTGIKVVGNAPKMPTPTVTKTAEVPVAPVPVNLPPEQCVSNLPLAAKLGQKIGAPVFAEDITANTIVLKQNNIGTALLMTSPIHMDNGKINKLTDKNFMNIPATVAVDEEGGTVQRITADGKLPSAAEVAAMNPAQLEAFKATLTKHYIYLKEHGITTIFAPVADVGPVTGLSKIGDSRIFSKDPNVVASDIKIYLDIANKVGIKAVLKHFPGGGSMSRNTDEGVATIPAYEQLLKRDLVPYTVVKGIGANLMVGSMVPEGVKAGVPGWTNGKPADLSPVTYKAAREQFGFGDSVISTDDLGTKAINMPLDKAFVEAWVAGADVPVFVHDSTVKTPVNLEQQIKSIVKAGEEAVNSGALPIRVVNESVTRILKDKKVDACDALEKVDPETYNKLATAQSQTKPSPTANPSVTGKAVPLPAKPGETGKVVPLPAKPSATATAVPLSAPVPTPTATKK